MPVGYRANTETITALTAQTVTFADNTLPQGGIAAFFIETTGVNNHLGTTTPAIDSLRVKLEGVPVLDMTAAMIRTLIESLSPGNGIPVSNRLRFTLPMSLPWSFAQFSPWSAGVMGIPFGVKTSVEIVLNAANSSAGAATIGWQTLPAAPVLMPKCIQQATNVAASTTNGRIQINYGNNLVVGFFLPVVSSTGITRIRIVRMNPNGTEEQVLHADQAIFLESQWLKSANTLITTSFFLGLPEPTTFPAGSYLEVDTGAGSAATDLFAALQLVNVAPANVQANKAA